MPAYAHEVEEAREEGIDFLWLTVPVRFVRRAARGRGGVECRRMQLGAPDASGRPRPEPVPGSEFVLPVDTVVKAIGQQPRSELFGRIDGVELAAAASRSTRRAAPAIRAGSPPATR